VNTGRGGTFRTNRRNLMDLAKAAAAAFFGSNMGKMSRR
jgi:hypothetical protein